MSYRSVSAILIVAALATATHAQQGGTITSPQFAQYSLTGSPASQTDNTNANQKVSFTPPAGGNNQLFWNWFYFRAAGDSVQYPVGNYPKSNGYSVIGTSNWPVPPFGNQTTATDSWTDFGTSGAISGALFTTTVTFSITSGPSQRDAAVRQSIQLTNPNSSPIAVSFFELVGPGPGGVGGGALSATGDLNSIVETNGAYDVTFSANGATAYQAGTDGSLGNLLYGGAAADLNNTGLPAMVPASSSFYISLAYEWTETIPANGSVNFNSAITLSQAVPEPSTLLLTGAAAGALAGLKRWRRSTSKLSP